MYTIILKFSKEWRNRLEGQKILFANHASDRVAMLQLATQLILIVMH